MPCRLWVEQLLTEAFTAPSAICPYLQGGRGQPAQDGMVTARLVSATPSHRAGCGSCCRACWLHAEECRAAEKVGTRPNWATSASTVRTRTTVPPAAHFLCCSRPRRGLAILAEGSDQEYVCCTAQEPATRSKTHRCCECESVANDAGRDYPETTCAIERARAGLLGGNFNFKPGPPHGLASLLFEPGRAAQPA